MRRGRGLLTPSVWVVMGLLLAPACVSHPRVQTVLHESSRGTVFLKEFPDATIQASHPAHLDPDLMRRILAGVRVQERKTMIESTLTGDTAWMPTFTLPEADFLAPLLSSALGQATAREAVHFRLTGAVSGKRLAARGAVYATPGTLHLSLTEFGATPQRPATLSQPSRSFDRAKRWALTFVPAAALVNGDVEAQVSGEGARPNVLTISLDGLARSPDSTGRDGGDEEVDDELRRLRDRIQEQQERLERLEQRLQNR